MKDVSVLPKEFRTSDHQPLSRIFSSSWNNVKRKDDWKSMQATDSDKILLSRLHSVLKKLDLINIPTFCVLGGKDERGPNFAPVALSTLSAIPYKTDFHTSAEDYYFASQTKVTAYRKSIPLFIGEIKTDNVDYIYLKKCVSAALLSMCSK